MARPKKPADEKMEQRIQLYFTTSDFAKIQAEAERTGMDIGVYARQAILSATQEKPMNAKQIIEIVLNELAQRGMIKKPD